MPTLRHMAERRELLTSVRSSSPRSLGRMSLMMGTGAKRVEEPAPPAGRRGPGTVDSRALRQVLFLPRWISSRTFWPPFLPISS